MPTISDTLLASGFTLQAMGGNTTAWFRDVDGTAYVLITDDDCSHVSDTSTVAWVGLHDDSGDEPPMITFAPGWNAQELIEATDTLISQYLSRNQE
jgi:hypothetical protein